MKNSVGGTLIFLGGVIVGTHIQSKVVERRLKKAADRAYAGCETAQDIVDTDRVFSRMVQK